MRFYEGVLLGRKYIFYSSQKRLGKTVKSVKKLTHSEIHLLFCFGAKVKDDL